MTPEQQARQKIDAQLFAAGWIVQDYPKMDPSTRRGIAIRKVPLNSERCDYRAAPADQTRNLDEVERRLSLVEELEAVVSVNLQRAARLRQSILERAFKREL